MLGAPAPNDGAIARLAGGFRPVAGDASETEGGPKAEDKRVVFLVSNCRGGVKAFVDKWRAGSVSDRSFRFRFELKNSGR